MHRAKTDGTYNLEDLKNKQKTFGTIVLECDLDIMSSTTSLTTRICSISVQCLVVYVYGFLPFREISPPESITGGTKIVGF